MGALQWVWIFTGEGDNFWSYFACLRLSVELLFVSVSAFIFPVLPLCLQGCFTGMWWVRADSLCPCSGEHFFGCSLFLLLFFAVYPAWAGGAVMCGGKASLRGGVGVRLVCLLSGRACVRQLGSDFFAHARLRHFGLVDGLFCLFQVFVDRIVLLPSVFFWVVGLVFHLFAVEECWHPVSFSVNVVRRAFGCRFFPALFAFARGDLRNIPAVGFVQVDLSRRSNG